jgi:hypothetical protein
MPLTQLLLNVNRKSCGVILKAIKHTVYDNLHVDDADYIKKLLITINLLSFISILLIPNKEKLFFHFFIFSINTNLN